MSVCCYSVSSWSAIVIVWENGKHESQKLKENKKDFLLPLVFATFCTTRKGSTMLPTVISVSLL